MLRPDLNTKYKSLALSVEVHPYKAQIPRKRGTYIHDFFSLKPQHSFDYLPPIPDFPLERVYSYKYLGLDNELHISLGHCTF